MIKKIRQIIETKFKIIIVIMTALFVVLLYYGIMHDRFQVHESNGIFAENQLIKNQPLVYGTEFCANKLSNLAHDIHFIERDIKEEKELMKKESAVAKEEEKVIAIEQEELNKLKSEFQKYKDLCDEFDQNPTEELCSQFLKDAKYDLELLPKDSRANRIYNNLVKICE
jgi:hypothetical protein